jgi:aerobic-type carbon monoxide dehydrogenase small subunit (CoxS/CutS family)
MMSTKVTLSLNINNTSKSVESDGHATLLTVLRDGLGITSPKRGCNQGVCGSCTVMIDGTPQRSCLTLAAACESKTVRTIDGYADDPLMQALQNQFRDCGAVQCGFCTAGLLISAYALLQENPAPDLPDVQNALSGNICRCTGYRKIVDGVIAAAKEVVS